MIESMSFVEKCVHPDCECKKDVVTRRLQSGHGAETLEELRLHETVSETGLVIVSSDAEEEPGGMYL